MPPEDATPAGEPTAVSLEEAARRIDVSKRTAYRLHQNDPTFPSYYVGSRIVVSVAGLREWDAKRLAEKRDSAA